MLLLQALELLRAPLRSLPLFDQTDLELSQVIGRGIARVALLRINSLYLFLQAVQLILQVTLYALILPELLSETCIDLFLPRKLLFSLLHRTVCNSACAIREQIRKIHLSVVNYIDWRYPFTFRFNLLLSLLWSRRWVLLWSRNWVSNIRHEVSYVCTKLGHLLITAHTIPFVCQV